MIGSRNLPKPRPFRPERPQDETMPKNQTNPKPFDTAAFGLIVGVGS
jgi:hypothetical protein